MRCPVRLAGWAGLTPPASQPSERPYASKKRPKPGQFRSAQLLANLRNLAGFASVYGSVTREDATVGAILLWLLGIPIPIIILLLLLWH